MSGWTPGERGIVALAAELAAPVHETRSWVLQFHDDAHGVSLYGCLDRALPRHDPRGRDRLISCGTALTNVLLAMRALGWALDVRLRPDHAHPDEVARVVAVGRRAPADPEFARYLATMRRVSCRRPFAETPVDAATLRLLTAHDLAGVEVRLLAGADESAALAKLLCHTAVALRADHACQLELSAWTAPDKGPVARLARGTTAVLDLDTLADRLRRECLLLVVTPDDGPLDQVRAGMAAQTMWLTATDVGLAGSVLTQPFQLPQVRAGLVEALSLAGFPQLLLRLGHPSIEHDKEKGP